MIIIILNYDDCHNFLLGALLAHNTRQRMIEATQILVARHGSHGTSFGDILAESGAPRGSLYHHFPGGKEELITTAVRATGARALGELEALRGASATEIAAGFVSMWRQLLTLANFTVGCAVAGVAVDAESDDLVDLSGEIFAEWTVLLASLLTEGGIPSERAPSLAAILLAGCEGGVILARAARDLAPFERVAGELIALISEATPAP